MNNRLKSLTFLTFPLAFGVAAPVSARTYDLNFGPTLTGQLTTSDVLIGGGYEVTDISGSFMGQAITGIFANPNSPNVAYYYVATGSVHSNPAPDDFITYEYFFDNLVLPGNSVDDNGLLFSTSSYVVNLFEDEGDFYLDYVSAGPSDAAGDANPLTGTITATVPEPKSWLMLLVGFGTVGWAMRWRRNDLRSPIAIVAE